jgi:predicted dehydrogenase
MTLQNLIIFLSFQIFFTSIAFSYEQNDKTHRFVILGLGGRSQYLLLECLKYSKNIQVVAVCDDAAISSYQFFVNKLVQQRNPLLDSFKKCFSDVSLYSDTQEGLINLFKNHQNIDYILITSANYKHISHLTAACNYSSCKNIYIEKPLFRNFEEFNRFNIKKDIKILVGLTLRYATMTKIIVQKLLEHKKQLGNLRQVKAQESVRFCQGLTSFMMSWRRYISLSGGLLLEKCIHDLDLALFFISSYGFDPYAIDISTHTAHNFFKASHQKNILHEITHNTVLNKTLLGRELSPFQRLIPFTFSMNGNIDWSKTIDAIFKDFPLDDNFAHSDIIPDYHRVNAVLHSKMGKSIDFELEVQIGSLSPTTTRTMKFVFQNGDLEIDVMESIMKIKLHNGTQYKFDLQTNNNDHADGDEYIAQALLSMLPAEKYVAEFSDPVVQLATMIGLISEQQALLKDNGKKSLKKITDQWIVDSLA